MLTDGDRGYYESRAEQELLMAAASGDRNACASHYGLANLYIELASGAEREVGEAVPSQ